MSQKVQIQNIYGLSPMQEGMLFHSLMDSDSSAYFEQMSFIIEGKIDLPKFEDAFNTVIDRYDILRTIFKYEKVEKPLQIVLKDRKAKIRFEDIRGLNIHDQDITIKGIQEDDRKKGFDLARNILMRLIVIQTEEEAYRVIWSHHHILMDGWCLGIIIKEFVEMYESLIGGKSITFPEVIPYSNFISWLEKRDREQARKYWKEYLDGYEKQVSIPQKDGAKSIEGYKKGQLHFKLGEDASVGLQQLAKDRKITISVVVQAAWGILLQRYNYTDDAIFGAVVSGRPPDIKGVEGIVGLFINTIPVRVKNSAEMTILQLLQQLQEASVASTQYDYFPLAEIQTQSDLKSDLINNIIAFENYPVEKEIEDRDRSASEILIKEVKMVEQTNYGFIMVVIPGKELLIKLEYNQYMYNHDTVSRIKDHFLNILEEMYAHPTKLISEIDMIGEKEKKQLLDIYEGR